MGVPLSHAIVRIIGILLLGLMVLLVAGNASRIPGLAELKPSWLSERTIIHTMFLLLTLAIWSALPGRKLGECGFAMGTFRPTVGLFLWVLPMAILSTIGTLVSRSAEAIPSQTQSAFFHEVVFIWIFASICEECFTRGLLQSLLSPLSGTGFMLFRRWFLGAPVLFSALFFGLMHIPVAREMGPIVVILATLLGLVAGYYRQQTGSLIPAVIVHMLFNIGGSLPVWLLSRSG